MADGAVVQILLAPDAGAPMEAVDEVKVIEGEGLAGDRYAAGIGTFSGRGGDGRHVTLVEVEAAVAAGLKPADTRRNIVTRGIALNDLVGRQFRIGEVVLRGVRLCHPCALLEQRSRPGARAALEGRGGLRADIVKGGTIRTNDAVAAVTSDSDGAARMLTR